MEVQLIKLNKIKVNDKNPRTITEDKLRRLIESILVFPKMLSIRPIVIDDKGVALGGNMRTRALKEIKKLGRDAIPERLQQIRQYANKPQEEKNELLAHWDAWFKDETVPVIHAESLTEEEKREFIIKDNSSFGAWDWDVLANEWESEQLEDWGVDVWQIDETEDEDNNYSRKIEAPDYEPTGRNVTVDELYDARKTERLIEEIERLKIDEDVRRMLIHAAHRFTRFSFANVAEWYSQQKDERVREIMRKMAMVIIDFDDAVENGFVHLCEGLIEQYQNEKDDEDTDG
ncbi:MAG: hypothetical protein IIZ94_08300 [Prevotella sp.]|nr:hypothetical protein [Prevotella sp.]